MNYTYEFEESDGVFVIHTFEGGEELSDYQIRTAELDDLSYDDAHISEWIRHLLPKTWMTHDGLYQLSREIRKHHPQNQIDWRATFSFIERARYLHQKEQQAEQSKEDESAFDRVFKSITLRKELREQPGFDEMIDEKVNVKLREENIEE